MRSELQAAQRPLIVAAAQPEPPTEPPAPPAPVISDSHQSLDQRLAKAQALIAANPKRALALLVQVRAEDPAHPGLAEVEQKALLAAVERQQDGKTPQPTAAPIAPSIKADEGEVVVAVEVSSQGAITSSRSTAAPGHSSVTVPVTRRFVRAPSSESRFDVGSDVGSVENSEESESRWWLGLAVVAVTGVVVFILSMAQRQSQSPPSALPQSIPTSPVSVTAEPLPTLARGEEPQVGSSLISAKDGMEMVYVPAGEFLMGSPEGEGNPDEYPQHTVYLDAYYIDRTEVTGAMYDRFVTATGYESQGGSGGPDYPVVNVSWDDAQAYCQWAGKHLPTEAEWEKAARGTDGGRYPWGNDFDGSKVNFCDVNCRTSWTTVSVNDGYEGVAPVGSFPSGASPYGVLDMAGNLYEWVADYYEPSYYQRSPDRNPTGPSTGYRIVRGGALGNTPEDVRAARRFSVEPSHKSVIDLGFRCAVSAVEADAVHRSQDASESTSSRIMFRVRVREKDGMEMVNIPAGEFIMGSPEGEGSDDERPQHTVYLDEFWIDRTEVTNAQYRRCVEVGVCTAPPNGPFDDPAKMDHPVVFVSWRDAKSYCGWVDGRLPTEAEWEKAARGVDGRIYPWGNDWDPRKLNSKEAGPGTTTSVGSYLAGASPYRALDMAGNVWEWAADWFDEATYTTTPRENPTGPGTGSVRVLRGGSWSVGWDLVRAANRGGSAPDGRGDEGGFRCAR